MSAQMCIYVTNSAELYKNTTENRKVHICQDFFFWLRGVIYKKVGFYLECLCLCEELSGGYSQEMSMLRISVPKSQFSCRLILMIMKCKDNHL